METDRADLNKSWYIVNRANVELALEGVFVISSL